MMLSIAGVIPASPMNATTRSPLTPSEKLVLRCSRCGERVAGPALACPRCPDALLRSEYEETGFRPLDRQDIFRFADWLPSKTVVDTPVGPMVYESERLARHLGLSHLVVAFNGYAPEVGAQNPTGTFKDFEALPTLLYLREAGVNAIVLASAGSTARAFAHAGTLLGFRTYIVVPETALGGLWLPIQASDAVRLIVLNGSGDYSAAIEVAGAISSAFSILSEGGARNVARRDGMGTALLEYARTFGALPAHYIQAVGSGTGGIAAWEAAVRLIASGSFHGPLPRLHLVQNAPFAPIHDAWSAGAATLLPADPSDEVRRIAEIRAPVLANRRPPYALAGGVREALRATGGRTYAVTNEEIVAAQRLFEDLEGVPVGPEAGAALCGLEEGLGRGWIGGGDAVLLHVTGNGDALLRRDFSLRRIEPWLRIGSIEEVQADRRLERWFAA